MVRGEPPSPPARNVASPRWGRRPKTGARVVYDLAKKN